MFNFNKLDWNGIELNWNDYRAVPGYLYHFCYIIYIEYISTLSLATCLNLLEWLQTIKVTAAPVPYTLYLII